MKKRVLRHLSPLPLAAFVLLAYVPALRAQTAASASTFGLHDGDRVTFYGDSITEQREYTEDVENFVLTRFPGWKVSFHNAGVGGDKVSGGWAGPVDLRLRRDVFAFNPTVVTVMLGMNDIYYRPEELGIFSTYAAGYRHIVEELQRNAPHPRITLIEPSPYDDVTREPLQGAGYNAPLVHDSEFIAQLSHERQTLVADFNTPVNALLKTLQQQSPEFATQVIPDRIHPAQAGHWIMAESLLKAWNAPAVVSSVVLSAGAKGGAEARNAQVTDLHAAVDPRHAKARLTWSELDAALPLPFPPAELDPVMALTLKASDLLSNLDQQTLQVHGLPIGNYDLLIDDRRVATLTSDELVAGVNLATLDTPMLAQARLVAYDTERKNDIESAWFKVINVSAAAEALPAAAALARAIPAAEQRQRQDAQPVSHRFELTLEGSAAPAPQ
ncbi:MAG TPA: SGNH/GDSL hydrolase family protein [Acidisarcina sp.]